MNTNVVFMSPRAIKSSFIAPVLDTLNVTRVLSFLSMDNMPQNLIAEIVKRPYSIYDDSLPFFSMDDAVYSVATQIIETVFAGELSSEPSHGNLANKCILILADWQCVGDNGYEQYYNWLKSLGETYGRWTDTYNPYPYQTSCGSLTSLVVDRINSLLMKGNQNKFWDHVSIVKVSVFFTPMDGFSLHYNPKRGRWFEPRYRSRKNPSQSSTFIRHLKLLIARKDESRFVYTNAEGKRMMYRAITDEALENLKSWMRQVEERERREREMEERLLWGDDDNDNDVERGCGNGWTCDNCPNVGCPANELN